MTTNVVMQTNSVTDRYCEFHNTLRATMQLCRFAGLFPVDGLSDKTVTGLRFNLRSMYFLYYATTLFGQAILSGLTIWFFFNNSLGLENLKALVFYVTGCISAVLLSKLARDWPQLMRKASYIESRIATIRTTSKKRRWIIFGVMISALLEHILSIIFQLKFVIICYHDYEFDVGIIRNYFSRVFVFNLISYSEWRAVLYEIVNLQSTFTWNVIDAVTMSVSLYLTSYFNDLNKYIELQKEQNSVNWKEIRLHYSYLVELVNAIDEKIRYLILMSFFTNLCFVCVQLYHLTNYTYPVVQDCTSDEVEQVLNSMEHSIYYTYSFTFLFIRASITSLLAANIDTVARRPLLVLQNVSTAEYTIEVQRFIRQVRYTTTALSGLCFYITRGMILTVIATVVKYELVILQFSTIN